MSLVKKYQLRSQLALGKEPVELVLENCKIVNVFSHSIVNGNIAIDSGKIIGVGDYTGKKHVDMEWKYVLPGLIDSHEHLESSLVTPSELSRVVVPQGTTSIIADPHEIANVCGIDGIKYMMECSKNIPVNVFFMLPSCVPATDFESSGAILNAEELESLIDHPLVLGLGELMDYPSVINGTKEVIEKMILADKKIIDGHGPEIKGKKLNAYTINGIRTDHECSTTEEMSQRINNGLYIAIREGSAAKDLRQLIQGVNRYNSRRCTFCTDDKNPEDILRDGHINHNVKLAIKSGIDPITAIQMATINTAECYNLKDIGAIAPGYDADLVVVNNLEKFDIESVYKSGRLVAEHGKSLFTSESIKREKVLNTVHLPLIQLEDLKVPLEHDIVNVISIQPFSLITDKVVRKVSLNKDNEFVVNKHLDIVKVAVIERHKASGNIGIGLVENFNIKNGAIATTIAHDSHNLIVIGDNDEDMLAAIHAIDKLNGGIILVQDGKILDQLSLPIAGLMSDQPMEFVNEKLINMHKIAHEKLFVNKDIDPFMTLSFLALPVIPKVKITDKGLFDVEKFGFINYNVD